MQVIETLSEGLKREFKVVLPATDLDARVAARLDELKGRVQIPGFRPGKVPLTHLKRLYGKSVMAEVIEQAVADTNAKIVDERGFRLAMEPRVTLPREEDEVKTVLEGRSDLAYSVSIEILPQIAIADLKGIAIEKLVAEPADSEIDEAIQRIAKQNAPYSAKDGAAETGDKVTIDFVGTIDGEAFNGGTGEDVGVVIGSNAFIPGFEEQLVGIKAGEDRTVEVTFPTNYLEPTLAGKAASFAVKAKAVEIPGEVTLDDEFAKTLGMESLEKLRGAIRDQIAREHGAVSRRRLKRQLLDQLDERHRFDLPPTLVDQEFEGVWRSVLGNMGSMGKTFADEGQNEDEARAEYRGIAERRVRLGLVLAEIGDKNDIKVTDEEVTRALVERARQFPGQEREVWDYYRKNPSALASLRAPIFEEKVVDFLVELATVTERKVTREELYKEDDEEAA